MSDLYDNNEYHSDVTVTHDKDDMSKHYVQICSVTTSMHFKTRKLTG